MERLKERRFAPGSLEAEASELLRAREAYVVPEGLKRRVRERLLQGPPKRWRSALFRPALALACSLLAVGALAAVGGVALRPREDRAPLVRMQAGAAPPVASARPQAQASTAAPPPAVDPSLEREHALVHAPAARAAAEPGDTRRGAHADAPSEAALVYGAAKALRNHGEAGLAAKLLDDYARRYSHGALAEEALALSIDVSIARADGRAKELAQRYLARYPNGHFRAKAERELAR